jgi:hypothetical protein
MLLTKPMRDAGEADGLDSHTAASLLQASSKEGKAPSACRSSDTPSSLRQRMTDCFWAYKDR